MGWFITTTCLQKRRTTIELKKLRGLIQVVKIWLPSQTKDLQDTTPATKGDREKDLKRAKILKWTPFKKCINLGGFQITPYKKNKSVSWNAVDAESFDGHGFGMYQGICWFCVF